MERALSPPFSCALLFADFLSFFFSSLPNGDATISASPAAGEPMREGGQYSVKSGRGRREDNFRLIYLLSFRRL